jgi:hypothetical protein
VSGLCHFEIIVAPAVAARGQAGSKDQTHGAWMRVRQRV